MRVTMETCPRCNQLSNMNSSVSSRVQGEKIIVTVDYHCEKCHSFVRSEDKEEALCGDPKGLSI